jgi:hypothetical protein
MVRDFVSLEGIKFLSLKNRSGVDSHLNPKKLVIADSVLRELEVRKLLIESPVLCSEPPVCIPVTKEAIVEAEIEIKSRPIVKVDLIKTPFLACIQYDCLENSSDIIYKLIMSVKEASSNHGDKSDLENPNPAPTAVEKIESSQGQRLMELSEWRQQLILKLSSYDPTGTVQMDTDVPGTNVEKELVVDDL